MCASSCSSTTRARASSQVRASDGTTIAGDRMPHVTGTARASDTRRRTLRLQPISPAATSSRSRHARSSSGCEPPQHPADAEVTRQRAREQERGADQPGREHHVGAGGPPRTGWRIGGDAGRAPRELATGDRRPTGAHAGWPGGSRRLGRTWRIRAHAGTLTRHPRQHRRASGSATSAVSAAAQTR